MYENIVNIIKSIIALYGAQEIKDYTKRLSKSHTFMESVHISENIIKSYDVSRLHHRFYAYPIENDYKSLTLRGQFGYGSLEDASLMIYYQFYIDNSCKIIFVGEIFTSITIEDIFNYEYNSEDFVEHKLKWIKNPEIEQYINYLATGLYD